MNEQEKTREELLIELAELQQELNSMKASFDNMIIEHDETNQKLNLLLENSPVMIYTCQAYGGFDATYISENLKVYLGYETNEFLKIPNFWTSNIHPEDKERIFAGVSELFEGGTHKHEYRFKHKDGSWRWMSDSLKLQRDSNGNPKEIIGYWTDITEKKESEEQINMLAYAIKNSADCIVITDKNFQIIFVNDSFLNVYGYKKEEIIGQSIASITSTNNLPEVNNDLYSSLERKKKWTGEALNIRKDGIDFPVQLSLAPLLNDAGELHAIVGVIRDISERKQEELILKKSEEKYRYLVETTSDWIWEVDENGLYSYASQKSFDLLGYTPSEIVGKSVFDFMPPDEIDKIRPQFRYYAERKQSFSALENKNIHKEGREVIIETSAVPIIDENGELKGYRGIDRDITTRKQVELIIQDQNKELVKLNSDKNRFISILGHDLKGPFNSILGLLELLTKNFHNYNINEIEEYLQLVLKSAKNTFSLLEDILLWVNADSGKISYKPQAIEFTTYSVELIERFKQIAKQKNISINNIVSTEITLYADKNMMGTILRNLLSNAIKYSKMNGKIDMNAVQAESDIIISIADNGVGITPENLTKLFDISQIYTTKGTSNENGTGLGLLICKEFVEKHDGRIWVESEIGKGSTFYFSIPAYVPDRREITDSDLR